MVAGVLPNESPTALADLLMGVFRADVGPEKVAAAGEAACVRPFRYAPGEQYGTMWHDSGCHFDVTHHVSVLVPPSRRPFERPPVRSPG